MHFFLYGNSMYRKKNPEVLSINCKDGKEWHTIEICETANEFISVKLATRITR